MDILTIIVIAFGLTLDTFAVTVSTGLINNRIQFIQATRVAIIMSVIHALFLFGGWLVGSQLKVFIEQFDHWIAFILLLALGLKMIWEGLFNHDKGQQTHNALKLIVVISISIATSIDALVVGVSFGLINSVNIVVILAILTFVTYLVAMLGMLFGKKAGSLLGRKMDVIAGLLLIGMGIKILIEHV